MGSSRRKVRLESLIQQELSSYLIKDVQNPHIGFVTIVGVEMSPDLVQARVFVSVLGSDEDKQSSLNALIKTKGYLQYLLGKNLKIKNTPMLKFFLTDSLEQGDQLIQKIENLS